MTKQAKKYILVKTNKTNIFQICFVIMTETYPDLFGETTFSKRFWGGNDIPNTSMVKRW